MHARELEQLLQRPPGAGGWADECQNNFVCVDAADVAHIEGDVPKNVQRSLLPRDLGQRVLGDEGVLDAAVGEAVAEGENRLSGIKFVGSARVGEGRPHGPAPTVSATCHKLRCSIIAVAQCD